MRKLLLLIWAGCLFSTGFSQDSYNVLFQSGSVNFPENIQTYLQDGDLDVDQVLNRSYRYLQFYKIPTTQERQRIASRGIQLLDYIPNKTYLAALPANANPAFLLRSLGIRSIMRPGFGEKLSKKLSHGDLPNHAIQGNKLILFVRIQKDLDLNWAKNEVRAAGFEVDAEEIGSQYIKVSIPQQELENLAQLPYVNFIETIPPPPVAEDFRGRALHKSNAINSLAPMGRHYDGSGISILVRDDGNLGPHIDFQGRLNNQFLTGTSDGTHGDGVAGIMTGAGNLDPKTQGMAPRATLYVSRYISNFPEITNLHVNQGVVITNSSYGDGCNDGYTANSEIVDVQTVQSIDQTLLHVFSAGNSGTSDCAYGAGERWGNITGGHKIAKNAIATANLDSDGSLMTSSSRGPSEDGRIKPDLAANGNNHLSTSPGNAYNPFSGTSGAAPGVAGVATQLYQAYKMIHGDTLPKSGLIKAIMLNTADDLGNPGPDFRFGWGRVNAYQAAKNIEDQQFMIASIDQDSSNSHVIKVPTGVKEMRIMTYWMDPAAAALSSVALVNDLNAQLTLPDNSVLTPWVLDPSPNPNTLNDPAIRGIDSLNNMEQITVGNPAAGNYTLEVQGHSVAQGPQEYFVVYVYVLDEIAVTHPIGGENMVPGEDMRIHWEAEGDQGNFTLEYSEDDGLSWQMINNQVPGYTRVYDWQVPTKVTGKGRIRISRGAVSDQSDHVFHVLDVPQGLRVLQTCNNYIKIIWDAVDEAASYDIFLLGNTEMDSVGNTDQLVYDIPVSNPFAEYWITVRARGTEAIGRRAVAVSQIGGLRNCPNGNDLQILSIKNPIDATSFSTCASDLPVEIEVFNAGIFTQTGFSLRYRTLSTNNTAETFTDTLEPGEIKRFQFQTPFSLPSTPGAFTFRASLNVFGDQNPNNNFLDYLLFVDGNASVNAPYLEDFESYALCSNASDCEAIVCPLGNGWINAVNDSADDIDWRVNSGNTPSVFTGPSIDHTLGNPGGTYLYLEPSGGCLFREAKLISPCINIGGMTEPTLSLWYHMYGEDMGKLNIDIFNGVSWEEDIVSISGNQGDEWREIVIPLKEYADSTLTVQIRGSTGIDFKGDLAIDDFRIFEAAVPPTAAFSSDFTTICPGGRINFSDESDLYPTDWNWSVSPNTFSFTGSTDANSPNPSIVFQEYGFYTVSLTVSNAYGADSLVKQQLIRVRDGLQLPLTEDFEGITFPPNYWSILNPDLRNTWETRIVRGSNGQTSTAAFMNNFNYNASGTRDGLNTWVVDLSTSLSPVLTFEYASARRNATQAEELEVIISNDCGETFVQTIFSRANDNLITGGTQDNFWTPNSTQWNEANISLDPHIGNTIAVRFVNVNGNGNSLFLDNVSIRDLGEVAPLASLDIGNAPICPGDMVTISDTSMGNNLDYTWDFGADASPASATFAGPHQIQYSTPGIKQVILTLSNSSGTSMDTLLVEVVAPVSSDFQFALEPDTSYQAFTFTSLSQNADQLIWDFGDGTTSSQAQPTHTYTANGEYTITLIATNACGTDTSTQTLDISNVGIEELFAEWGMEIHPNPSKGLFYLSWEGELDFQELDFSLINLQGQQVKDLALSPGNTPKNYELDLRNYPKGIYFLQVNFEGESYGVKLINQ